MRNSTAGFFIVLSSATLLSDSYGKGNTQVQVKENTTFKTLQLHTDSVVNNQTVYVPIYAEIHFMDNNRKVDLTATLSKRNTDLDRSIVVSAVDYYDTMEKKLHVYFPKPIELGPLQTYKVIVGHEDNDGGTGANCIVQWSSYQPLSSPITECIIINSKGLSFTTQGKVINEFKR